jgi:hypothetical protein
MVLLFANTVPTNSKDLNTYNGMSAHTQKKHHTSARVEDRSRESETDESCLFVKSTYWSQGPSYST